MNPFISHSGKGVKSVNYISPDARGDVEIDISAVSNIEIINQTW